MNETDERDLVAGVVADLNSLNGYANQERLDNDNYMDCEIIHHNGISGKLDRLATIAFRLGQDERPLLELAARTDGCDYPGLTFLRMHLRPALVIAKMIQMRLSPESLASAVGDRDGDGPSAEEQIARLLTGNGPAIFRYLAGNPKGVSFAQFMAARCRARGAPLTTSDEPKHIADMLRKLSREQLKSHGYKIAARPSADLIRLGKLSD